MTEEQQHAIEHAQKVLRAVKLYDLAASLGATQGADARPVAIYQVEQAPGRWTNVSRETFDAWAFGKQIVYATRDAAPILGYRIDGADYTNDPLFTEEKDIADAAIESQRSGDGSTPRASEA